jgi:hypothetical protein
LREKEVDLGNKEVSVWECPNCGGNDFAEIEGGKHQCAYCGSVMTIRNQVLSPRLQEKPDFSNAVQCPRCGSSTERGNRYCNTCGQALVSGAPQGDWKPGTDPASISIIASIVGAFFIPGVGPILGLALGYKALKDARDGGKGPKSHKRARTAIVVGWVAVFLGALPICIAVGTSGVQWGYSLCESLFDGLFGASRLN